MRLPRSPPFVSFGAFELDLRARELRKDGCNTNLPEQSITVLAMLLDRPSELVLREEIRLRLWPNNTIVEFDHSINAVIRRLRVALDDSAESPRYIETLSRRGYRWIGPGVSNLAPAPTAPSKYSPVEAVEAQPQLAFDANLTGTKVSHYRVLEVLGGGGMGVVYKAEDLKLGRRVALKFLPDELVRDPVALQRIEQEARAASALNHPNVCTIYEIADHAGRPFIVMELLEGETLREQISRQTTENRRPTLDKQIDLGIQISDALAAAHACGIIHCDIKPANIFVTRTGVAKVLDFGMAKFSQHVITDEDHTRRRASGEVKTPERIDPILATPTNDLSLTRTGLTMGTAGYMSPEQVRGDVLDCRTDLFSFGLVLYEMTTGRAAFGAASAALMREAILNSEPALVRDINPDVPEELALIIRKALEKEQHKRYQTAAEMRADLEPLHRKAAPRRKLRESHFFYAGARFWKLVTAAVLIAALIAGGHYWWLSRRVISLTERDTVLLADFTNTTGDTVFDDTLKQGLEVQLEQSPFLVLVSDRRVNDTLRLMGRPAGDRLTPEIARDVCLRIGSKVLLTGSIAMLGRQYVVGLKAANCNTGDLLAEAQQPVTGKEAVLKALDISATHVRSKLGESLSSVQKYATPLEEATTPSLEALKAYSLGQKTRLAKADNGVLPFLKRAVELDPNFALAHRSMAVVYTNLSEPGRAADSASQAYALREKVSERERFAIDATYFTHVTGELGKASVVYEQWQQTYPRDFLPYGNLAVVAGALGDWEKALKETREALRLEPNNQVSYANLGVAYANLNRLDDADAAYKEAEEHKLESQYLVLRRYHLAFLKSDSVRMQREVLAAMGKPGTEDFLLAAQADTAGWHGNLRDASELTKRAMDSARRNDAREAAASYWAASTLRELESGFLENARTNALTAIIMAPNRDVRAIAILVLARAGESSAENLTNELDKTFPLDTLIQSYWLPTIRAAIALERNDPNRALTLLKVTSPIELSQPTNLTVILCPVYLRGEAYLMRHDGNAAAVEFQKFIDHRGLVVNFPWGAFARLGLARAYVIQGNTDKARTAYQDFLTLWKDADPDIPILRQAKTEYARLQ